MSADVQMGVVIAIVIATVVLLLRSVAKTLLGRKKAGCGSGCGKCVEPQDTAGRFPLPQA